MKMKCIGPFDSVDELLEYMHKKIEEDEKLGLREDVFDYLEYDEEKLWERSTQFKDLLKMTDVDKVFPYFRKELERDYEYEPEEVAEEIDNSTITKTNDPKIQVGIVKRVMEELQEIETDPSFYSPLIVLAFWKNGDGSFRIDVRARVGEKGEYTSASAALYKWEEWVNWVVPDELIERYGADQLVAIALIELTRFGETAEEQAVCLDAMLKLEDEYDNEWCTAWFSGWE